MKTLDSGFDLQSIFYSNIGNGSFGSNSFLDAIRFKLDAILSSIVENRGRVIVWSDVDIHFFGLTPERIQNDIGPHDMAFQRFDRNQNTACGGFYALRCTANVESFFTDVLQLTLGDARGNEQDAINKLLLNTSIPWKTLPSEYYARTHGFPPPKNILLHHATCVTEHGTVQQKIKQMREMSWIMKSPKWRRPYAGVRNAWKAIARKLSKLIK